MRIARHEVRVGERIGSGAQGVIYRAGQGATHGLPFGSVIYKEFSPGTKVSGAALEALTRIRDTVTDEERRVIDAMTVWPCAVVEDGGRVCGYLMQEIPDRFLQPIQTTTGGETIAREVQQLFVADDLARRTLGEVPTRIERLAIARELAFVLGFLHKRDLVFGDLSYKNEVYALRPGPSVMLLDCDAVRVRGQGSAVSQLNSPGWAAPDAGPQTIETDRYKLGLFVLRVVTPGVNAQNRDPAKADAVLDPEGRDLLRRALSDDPEARPSGGTWVAYLDGVIDGAGGIVARTGAAPAPPPPVTARRPAHAPVVPAAHSPFGVAAPVAPGRVRAPVAAVPPMPTPVGHPRPHRVHPAQVHGPPVHPTPAAGPPPALPSAGWGRTQWTASAVVAGALALLAIILFNTMLQRLGTGSGTTTSTARVSSSVSTTPAVPVKLAGAADAAVAIAGPVAGSAWQPVGLAAGGANPPDGDTTLEQGTIRWRVRFVPAGTATAAGPVTVREVDVFAGGKALEAPATTATDPAGLIFVPLPADVGTRLDAAVATVTTPSRVAIPVSYSWACPPQATEVEACRWLFSFQRVGGVETVWVAPDGSRIVDPPGWTPVLTGSR